ncbi:MAG TPA: hypothetical protein VGX23_03550 [Actinocrinis sp.]|nr:hypothetical protein [Actinocrinis sp.]
MIVLGVLLLIGAGVLGISALANNSGDAHQLPGGVAVLGYHLNMSTGRLFGYGLALGAAAMLGLVLLLAGSARMSRNRVQSRQTRRALAQARKNEQADEQAADETNRRTWPGRAPAAEPVVEEPVVETAADEPTLVQQRQSTPRRFRREQPVVVEQRDDPEQVPVVVGSASRAMSSDDADLTETRTD